MSSSSKNIFEEEAKRDAAKTLGLLIEYIVKHLANVYFEKDLTEDDKNSILKYCKKVYLPETLWHDDINSVANLYYEGVSVFTQLDHFHSIRKEEKIKNQQQPQPVKAVDKTTTPTINYRPKFPSANIKPLRTV